MRHKICIILVMLLLVLSKRIGMAESFNRMNNVRNGMTKSEVFKALGMKNYPSSRTYVNNYNTYESWQLGGSGFNNKYHDRSGHKISNRGVSSLTFENGKLININISNH